MPIDICCTAVLENLGTGVVMRQPWADLRMRSVRVTALCSGDGINQWSASNSTAKASEHRSTTGDKYSK